MLGGRAGSIARFAVDDEWVAGDSREATSGFVDLAPGQQLTFETSGGAGYGKPATRDPELIARDLKLGYITAAYAAREYGYEVDRVEANPDVSVSEPVGTPPEDLAARGCPPDPSLRPQDRS
jgi:N-methylhydantoinase B/oxoprolinase/acetone carboxylase alpha subunit